MNSGRHNEAVNILINSIDSKLAGWKKSCLSQAQAGRLVLVKSVLSDIPVHLFSNVLFSKKICLQMERKIRDFWQGFDQGSRAIYPCARDQVEAPIEIDGLGVRKMHE